MGMPVAFAIGISGALFFAQHPELPPTIPIQLTVTETQNFALLAVPLFILAGNLMNYSGITQRLLELATLLTGRLQGGLAQVSVALSTLMSGVTGSSIADAAMNSRLLGGEMLKRGFSRGYAAGVLAFGSLMAPIIPPGIGYILYGTVGPGLDRAAVRRRDRARPDAVGGAGVHDLDHRAPARLRAGARSRCPRRARSCARRSPASGRSCSR